jgi:hypothetical protein
MGIDDLSGYISNNYRTLDGLWLMRLTMTGPLPYYSMIVVVYHSFYHDDDDVWKILAVIVLIHVIYNY